MARKWTVGSESILLSHSRVTDIHRLAPVWRLKVQEEGVNQEVGLSLFSLLFPGILDQLGCILFSSSVDSRTTLLYMWVILLQMSPVSFSASSFRASCPRCLPPSSIPHPLPHPSHVSLMYVLVAFTALSSSTHRVPCCYPPPPTLISALHFCLLCMLNWCRVHGDSWDVFPSLLSSGLEIKRWC